MALNIQHMQSWNMLVKICNFRVNKESFIRLHLEFSVNLRHNSQGTDKLSKFCKQELAVCCKSWSEKNDKELTWEEKETSEAYSCWRKMVKTFVWTLSRCNR